MYHQRGRLIHGYPARRHPLYSIWAGMKDRCYNPKNKAYKNYGGRGISVATEWRESFECFAIDMGLFPDDTNKYTIERINNDLGYSKDNCKWATQSEQAKNKRVYKTSLTGVSGIRKTNAGTYQVRTKYDRKLLGCFHTLEEAIDAQQIGKIQDKPRISNTSGYKGISAHRDGGFIVRKILNGKRIYLGYFKSLEEAIETYENRK